MLALALVLTLGIAAGWLSRHLDLPAAVGQVALGALLGPATLGWWPRTRFCAFLPRLALSCCWGWPVCISDWID